MSCALDNFDRLADSYPRHLDYITSKQNGAAYTRKSFTVTQYEEGLKSKVYLLKHFERYIMDRLYGEYPFTYEDVERAKGMDFVQKYLRMKHVIAFKLSNDTMQVRFNVNPDRF